MKLGGNMGNGSRKNPLSFSLDPQNKGEIWDFKFKETDGEIRALPNAIKVF